MERGVSRFSVENFWSHSAEEFRGHPFNVSEILGYRKVLCIIGGITFFCRKCLVSQCQKISWACLQCFRKFGVLKNFKHNRGYHVFPSKIFGHSAEEFRGHPFNVSEILGYRKVLCIIGGITFFCRKCLVSQCQKISWACLQCFRKFGVLKNFKHNKGYHVFPSKIFGIRVPKNFVGIRSMFQKIWGIEKFYA